jgi:phenylalanyl-tRNA synthetase alpha subunit
MQEEAQQDIVGKRTLSSQRCIDMDWNNAKEITAWEIAWCIHNHDGIDINTKQLPEKRQASIQKQLNSLQELADRQQTLYTLAQKKNELEEQYHELDLTSCKTLEQVECVQSLIEDQNLNELSNFIKNDFTQRDTQHYPGDLKSYNDHLQKALTIHRQYNHNFQDSEAIETVEYFFQQLIDLGLPKPFTKKEIQKNIYAKSYQSSLEGAGLSPTPAIKLSKQITKIHFPR